MGFPGLLPGTKGRLLVFGAALKWTLILSWGWVLLPAAARPLASSDAAKEVAAPPFLPAPRAQRATEAENERFQGLRVRDITFRGVSPRELDEMRGLVTVEPGQPLDKRKLRESLQRLYTTGRFSDIQVEAERTPQNELALVFVAEENYFVGSLTLVGGPKGGPTDTQMINASKLLLGERFAEENVRRGLENMKRALAENGYYQAEVRSDYTRHDDTRQVDIHFTVQAGEQARIGRVVVQGTPGFTVEQVADIAKLHPGDRASASRLRRALERLRKRYRKEQRIEAQVFVVERIYHAETNTVDPVFRMERGPTVDIHVEGARISNGLLKKHVPVYEENAVDDDLLNEGRRNLRDYFQTKGYFDARVGVRQSKEGDDHRNVVYDVDRGERHKLTAVDIEWSEAVARPGAQPYFDAETIRERMQVQPAGRLLSHGLFSQSLLNRDIASIENLHQANGFQQVKVTSTVQSGLNGDPGVMRVSVHISEGPQTLVAALHIEGNKTISDDEIRARINTLEGQPFSESTVAQDRDLVINHYFNSGFPSVRMEHEAQPVPGDPTRMNVTFRIQEGERVSVDRVLVSGLRFTRPYVVEREQEAHGGDPLSQRAMFATQRKLYDLGIFNQVDVAIQNPEGRETEKNLLIDIKEARRYTFNYGFGLEVQTGGGIDSTLPQGRTGFSPRVSFEMTRINFRGRDHTVVFKTRLGRLQQRGLISYEAPRWFGRDNLKLTFTTFYDTTRDVRTFTSDRLEGSVQAEHTYSPATTFLYRYTYRRVKARDLNIDPGLIALASRPVRVGMPSFTYVLDKRQPDPLDTQKGIYTTADVGVSSGVFGSEASFARFLAQNSTYHPLGRRKNVVLARSTRIGIEQPWGDYNIGAGTLDRIPLPERFFAGGGNSHRGFPINQAGPRDLETGFPIGGAAMFLNNVELRLPPVVVPFIEDNVSFVLFHDMGNVFTSPREMARNLASFKQDKLATCRPYDGVTNPIPACDFNYMAHAIGAGLRYKTPIGPVRVDFGYNLNPPTFLVNRENRTETARRFNFFFSIGQTF